MSNNIVIRNLDPQEITINEGGTVTGITNVYVNGTDVTIGTKAYVIVPTKLSELTNDEGFITNAEETDPTVPSFVKNITQADINSWNAKQEELVSTQNIKSINGNSILGSGNLNITNEYIAGVGIDITDNTISNTITSYNDLTDTPTPIQYTSQLINDSGYITNRVDDLQNYLTTNVLESILPHSSDSGTGDLYLENSAHYKLDITLNPSEIQQTTLNGYNLFDIDLLQAAEKNNVTLIKNGDGTITLNGTASADANFDFYITSITADSSYKLQLYNQDGSYSGNYVSVYMATDNTWGNFDMLAITTNPMTSMSLGSKTYTYARVKVNNGVACNNLKIGVQVVDDSSITTFEPYTGGMPSPNPLYPQDIHVVTGENSITVCGKNLYNGVETHNGINSSGVISTNNNYLGISDYISIQPNTTYTITFEHDDTTKSLYLGYETEDGTFINRTSQSSRTFTTPNNAYYVFIYVYNGDGFGTIGGYIQLERGSTATTYVPYQETVYPIELGSIELCKFTGGIIPQVFEDRIFKNIPSDPDYVPVAPLNSIRYNKKVVKFIPTEDMTWTDEGEFAGTHRFSTPLSWTSSISNAYVSNYFGNDSIPNQKNYISLSGGKMTFIIDNNLGITTVSDWTNWLSNNTDIVVYYADDEYYMTTSLAAVDPDLSSQYNNILNESMAYEGGTNIIQENDDLPFDIIADTLEKISS